MGLSKRIDYSRRIDGGPLDHGFDQLFGTACCPTTDWLYAFIVRWPGNVQPSSTSDQLTSLADVMATAAAVVGKKLPRDAAEDSYNMLPALLGQAKGPIRQYVVQQGFGGERYLAIRRGEWKYLDHKGSGGNRYESHWMLKDFMLPDTAPDTPGQLYSLKTDPGETTNVSFEYPVIVKELKSKLEEFKESGSSAPFTNLALSKSANFGYDLWVTLQDGKACGIPSPMICILGSRWRPTRSGTYSGDTR